jgi:rare lipoprotein A
VTNLENGKSVVVRINDRGPFKKSRVMDMSYAAAYRLGYNNKGSARVRIEAIIPGAELPPVAPVLAVAPPAAPSPKAEIPVPAVPVVNTPPGPIAAILAGADDPLMAMADAGTPPPAAPTPVVIQAPVATAIAPVTEAGLWLQIAAFGSQATADAFRAKLAAEWNGAAQPAVVASGKVWRVRLGPFASDADANKAATRIASAYSVRPMVVH